MQGGYYMEQNTQQDRAKLLEQQAREYLMRSNDPIFTQYVQQLIPRIQKQPQYVEQLQAELDKSVEYWHQRQKLNAERAESAAAGQIQESVQPSTQEPMQEQPIGQAVGQPAGQFTGQPTGQFAEQPRGQSTVQPAAETVVPGTKKKQNAEYFIGTIALSVMGGVFILTALVLMGMYFMNGWIKGISLYVVSLGVVLLAELLIRRKLPKLAQIFSAIGMAALYLSTMINTLSLHNFGMLPAALIIGVITVGTVLLSRKRDSLIHRLLGIASCWLCAYPLSMSSGLSMAEVLMVMGLILILSILCACVPVHRFHTASQLILFASTTVLFPMVVGCIVWTQSMSVGVGVAAYSVFFLIAHLILVAQTRYAQIEKQAGHVVKSGGLIAVYIAFILVSGIMTGAGMDDYWRAAETDGYIGIFALTGIVFVITILTVIALRKAEKGWQKWLPCYFFSFVTFCGFSVIENDWGIVICATVLLIAVKILSRLAKGGLAALDAILTTVYCILLLMNGKEIPYAYVLLAGTILSMFLVHEWSTYQEIVLTFSLAFFALSHLMPMIKLPAFSGILFVSILLFNNVNCMRGKGILVFNVFVLIGQIGALIGLADPVYRNSYITYLCMFVFVLAYLVLTLQEKYYKNFKHRELILVIFLTYMALIVKTNIPVINSILIMLIALVSVTAGFVKKDKPVRIYGLVLSLCTCGKIALYDYWGAPILQKTILFFVVGVIALVIAGIYIILEKKCNE